MFENIITFIYLYYIRPIVKYFLFKFTKLHEVQRICYGSSGSARTKNIEKSLTFSRTPKIKSLVKDMDEMTLYYLDENSFKSTITDPTVNTVLQVKKINPKIHPDFPKLLATCTQQIWGYKRLYNIVEEIRTTPYNCDNLEHEKKLFELWNLLMPNVQLESRISKQWQDIGFQGDDPKTDFRGMGILGLENLLFFAREYNDVASHVLLHSLHPQSGYTFAIVGINLTSMAWRLLRNGMAKTHFYNVTKGIATMQTFHQFYCYLFFEFDKYWVHCKPRSIMDFPYIQENFESNIIKSLEDDKTVFKVTLYVENI